MTVKNGKSRTPEELEKNLLDKIKTLHERGIRCYLCKGEFGLGPDIPTRDHVRAISDYSCRKVGEDKRKKNLKWAHARCNKEKGNLPLLQYRINKNIQTQPNNSSGHPKLYFQPHGVEFYWICSNFDIILGPFSSKEKAIEGAKEWKCNNQSLPNRKDNDIFLVYSRILRSGKAYTWVWDTVYPRQSIGSLSE